MAAVNVGTEFNLTIVHHIYKTFCNPGFKFKFQVHTNLIAMVREYKKHFNITHTKNHLGRQGLTQKSLSDLL